MKFCVGAFCFSIRLEYVRFVRVRVCVCVCLCLFTCMGPLFAGPRSCIDLELYDLCDLIDLQLYVWGSPGVMSQGANEGIDSSPPSPVPHVLNRPDYIQLLTLVILITLVCVCLCVCVFASLCLCDCMHVPIMCLCLCVCV